MKKITDILLHPCLLRIGFTCYLGIILTLALVPMQGPEMPNGDKLNHLLAFAVFAFVFRVAFQKTRWFWLLGSGIAFGALIEVLQSFTPYRTMSFFDLCADTIGLLVGLLLILGFTTLLKKRKPV